MDILIPDSWLRKHLKSKVTPSDLCKYMSLCGPSFEKMEKQKDGDTIYSIEVTSNRVDSASVKGIAREASAILPRFNIKADFIDETSNLNIKQGFKKKVKYLDMELDKTLCPRFTAVLIRNVTIKESPKEIKSLLEKVGLRPINNIVDISNFIMHDLGQPVHTFDYDKITDKKMILRESKKGERVVTLDKKEFVLDSGAIVIEDGSGRLIDLCGIMGGLNSAIDDKTKNVLLFIQNYDKHHIRKTSMSLAQRSEAAVLFEKGLDSEMVKPAMIKAIKMIEENSGGKAETEILDIYDKPYKGKVFKVSLEKITKIIGVKVPKEKVEQYLNALGFKTSWVGGDLNVTVPSFRSDDINIPEDIAEEIARIYGYHNIPSQIMPGELPAETPNPSFAFESKIRQILSSLGGIEIYNLSLVSRSEVLDNALKVSNPLGLDTEYLRTSLRPSLFNSLKTNSDQTEKVHIFELSNIYISNGNELPTEKLMLCGLIKHSDYPNSKGVVESLLDQLNIEYSYKISDGFGFLPNQRLEIYSNKKFIGELGNSESGLFLYEFDVVKLLESKRVVKRYQDVSKYPAQIEDLTFNLPDKTYLGNFIEFLLNNDKHIKEVTFKDKFNSNYTFRIKYHNPNKTLSDLEVKEIRQKITKDSVEKFGAQIKD